MPVTHGVRGSSPLRTAPIRRQSHSVEWLLFFFVVKSRNLRHIPKSKTPRAVRRVLSRGVFFCDAPHLTTFDNKGV